MWLKIKWEKFHNFWNLEPRSKNWIKSKKSRLMSFDNWISPKNINLDQLAMLRTWFLSTFRNTIPSTFQLEKFMKRKFRSIEQHAATVMMIDIKKSTSTSRPFACEISLDQQLFRCQVEWVEGRFFLSFVKLLLSCWGSGNMLIKEKP